MASFRFTDSASHCLSRSSFISLNRDWDFQNIFCPIPWFQDVSKLSGADRHFAVVRSEEGTGFQQKAKSSISSQHTWPCYFSRIGKTVSLDSNVMLSLALSEHFSCSVHVGNLASPVHFRLCLAVPQHLGGHFRMSLMQHCTLFVAPCYIDMYPFDRSLWGRVVPLWTSFPLWVSLLGVLFLEI
ncbi:unnamed protein product [Polarella glacialis]|uniref:Uncharacterized protein n=1 Tax=Polarella glacialis TaxID=89957 RepID=A0A813CZQ0_POLGL|nr:unnamed protein product [Polarella glacialis]CAE8693850.1 unnamed protein product [Polarella glacialis]